MKKRARTERRVAERDQRKLVLDKQRLAELLPGGTPEHPIDVVSASVIPGRARSLRCPLCDGTMLLDEETAETVNGVRLRATQVTCQQCRVARRWWFRIGSPLAN